MFDERLTNQYLSVLDRVRQVPFKDVMAEAQKNQSLSPRSLEEMQLRKVNRILQHASTKSAFYRRAFAGIELPLKSLTDLGALPQLSKAQLRDNMNAILTDAPLGRVFRSRTSGSTGVALQFSTDSNQRAWSEVVQWRGRQWWNLDRGNKQLTLWGRPVAANPTSDLWVKLKAHLRNSMQVNTFEEFNEAKLEQILQLFLHKRPKLLYGYGSSIARLAAYTATRDVQPEQFGHCNLIEYTADAMTSAEKVLAEQVFGCPVVSAYGASEAPGIAQQCPEGNAHVAVDNVFLEWMPTEATNSGAPRSSEILVTTLNNFAMPLIRYRLGDEGYPLAGACNCGVSLPLMGLSVGKSMSLISTSSRQDISGHVLDYILISLLRDGFTGIGQFFVEQITLDYFEFYFVRCEPFRSNSTHEFVRRMKTELGEQIQVRISEVSNIEPRSSGKRTYFETRL